MKSISGRYCGTQHQYTILGNRKFVPPFLMPRHFASQALQGKPCVFYRAPPHHIQVAIDSCKFNFILVCFGLYFKRDMILLLHGLRIKWGLTIRHNFACRTLGSSVQYVLYEMESYLGKNDISGFPQFSHLYPQSL